MRELIGLGLILAIDLYYLFHARLAFTICGKEDAAVLIALKTRLEKIYIFACFATALCGYWMSHSFAQGASFSGIFIFILNIAFLMFVQLRALRALEGSLGNEFSATGALPLKSQIRFWAVFLVTMFLASFLSSIFMVGTLQFFNSLFGWIYHVGAMGIFVVAGVVAFQAFVFTLLSPIFFRCAFNSRKADSLEVIRIVKEVFQQAELPAPNIICVKMGRGLFAAVTGWRISWLGLRPTLLLSDALLNSLSQDELKAVLAHELVHVNRNHLFWRIFCVVAGIVMLAFYQFSVLLEIPAWLDIASRWQPLVRMILSLCGVFAFIYFLRLIVRYQEMEADSFAVAKFSADPKALISSLDKFLLIANRRRDQQSILSWLIPAAAHPSVAEREKIAFRAARRSKMGKSPLRDSDSPFFALNSFARAGRIGLVALGLWMISVGFLNIQKLELSAGLGDSLRERNFPAALKLIRYGADPKNSYVFLSAVNSGDINSVELLLRLGANPHVVDFSGQSAQELARRSGNLNMAVYLDRVTGSHRPELRFYQPANRSLASQPSQK